MCVICIYIMSSVMNEVVHYMMGNSSMLSSGVRDSANMTAVVDCPRYIVGDVFHYSKVMYVNIYFYNKYIIILLK